MKVAIDCKSPLLQRALEIFLSSYLTSLKHSEIILRDFKFPKDKKSFYISKVKERDSDLVKPFSKSDLILALEDRYETISMDRELPNFDILEKRIELLTKEYQENILMAVRTFYEK